MIRIAPTCWPARVKGSSEWQRWQTIGIESSLHRENRSWKLSSGFSIELVDAESMF